MKKPRHFIGKSSFHKDFGEIFVRLAERHGRHEVWSDFITMSACAVSNASDTRFQKEREAMYMAAVKRYTKDEADMLAQMLSYVIMALEENPEQDFLGEMFSGLNLHNEWRGQFFTPYHVGSFMAAINIESAKEELKQKEYITVNDCCCGAGCLLIAFANEARKAKIDFQNRVVFVAQDLDFTAAMMCYIQLSLLGCKAVVKVGNSLTDPFVPADLEGSKVWYTPMYTCGNLFRFMSVMNNKEENESGREENVSENPIEDRKEVEGKVSA